MAEVLILPVLAWQWVGLGLLNSPRSHEGYEDVEELSTTVNCWSMNPLESTISTNILTVTLPHRNAKLTFATLHRKWPGQTMRLLYCPRGSTNQVARSKRRGFCATMTVDLWFLIYARLYNRWHATTRGSLWKHYVSLWYRVRLLGERFKSSDDAQWY